MTRNDKIFAVVLTLLCVLLLIVAYAASRVRETQPKHRCVSYFHCLGRKK